MTTALNLITDALITARVYSPGESLPTSEANAVLRNLNRMLGTWANQNWIIFKQTEETLTLVVDQASYTIGETGTPDFNTVRPQEILEGTFVRESGGTLDYPLTVKTLEEYRLIRHKSISSIPWWIAYNPTFPNGTLYLFWTPGEIYELHLVSLKELGSFAKLATTVTLPPGYEDAIVYNLALRIGPDFGKTVRNDVVAFAANALKAITNRNTRRLPPVQLEVGGFMNRRGSRNFTTGPFV